MPKTEDHAGLAVVRSPSTNISVAVVSAYEGGLQPVTAISTASFLRASGVNCDLFDLYINADVEVSAYDLVVFIVPLYESIKDSVELATRLYDTPARPKILFCGSYAELVSNEIVGVFGDAVVAGDWEEEIVEIVSQLGESAEFKLEGKIVSKKRLGRRRVELLHELAPSLNKYSYTEAIKRVGKDVVVGPVETSRGCRFKCSYCSVFAVSGGKAQALDTNNVCRDIDALVDRGADHICFTDADFFNAPKGSLKVAEYICEEYPQVTFDLTTRADLVSDFKSELSALSQGGLSFVTTALEFPNDEVLERLNKGFQVSDIYKTLDIANKMKIPLNPTFLVFNPWIVVEDLMGFENFLRDTGLEDEIAPIQYRTRLWLYKGSPLLGDPIVQESITEEKMFHFEWKSKDHRVEEKYDEWASKEDGTLEKRCCLKC